jgi:alkyldihydroxyacetonephosphate synthase
VTIEAVLTGLPGSRLGGIAKEFPTSLEITDNPLQRLLHACGQSLPDWVALRSGRIHAFPDAVAYPISAEQVRLLLSFAVQNDVRLIPYGGGTSVVGHINPPADVGPVLTVDLSRINELVDLDTTSNLATFGAGVCGPDLEAKLKSHGCTLGHFPQSFELSTLGGWIATRSTGQQSYYYGRIESLFAGGHVETFQGPLDLPLHPASAAGPDLRQLILGSEGQLGIITHATVRVQPIPDTEKFFGLFFKDWQSGVDALREIAQQKIPASMLRLSNAQETEVTLILSGKEDLIRWARRGLGLLGYGPTRSMLIYGVSGDSDKAGYAKRQVNAICRSHGGLPTGEMIGKTWRKSRFLTPYLRNTLWERGYALDTLETALPWSMVLPAAEGIQTALKQSLAETGERVLVFSHLSHIYPDGASIYTTYLFPRAADPEETVERWRTLKASASQEVLAHGGTISHQHGVGSDHAPYLEAEKGELGMAALEAVRSLLDPGRLLNPGKMLR